MTMTATTMTILTWMTMFNVMDARLPVQPGVFYTKEKIINITLYRERKPWYNKRYFAMIQGDNG